MGIYLFLFAIVIPAITFVEARLLRPFVLLSATIALSAVYFSLRTRRRAGWAAASLLFDESEEPLVGGIHLTPE